MPSPLAIIINSFSWLIAILIGYGAPGLLLISMIYLMVPDAAAQLRLGPIPLITTIVLVLWSVVIGILLVFFGDLILRIIDYKFKFKFKIRSNFMDEYSKKSIWYNRDPRVMPNLPPDILERFRQNENNPEERQKIFDEYENRLREFNRTEVFRILESSFVFLPRLFSNFPLLQKSMLEVISPISIIFTFDVGCISISLAGLILSIYLKYPLLMIFIFSFALISFIFLSIGMLKQLIYNYSSSIIALHTEFHSSRERK